MKAFRKIVSLAAAVLTLISFCACSAEAPGVADEKSLLAHGMDVIAMMDELAGSSLYASLMSSDAAIAEYGQAAANGEYGEYSAVYAIGIPFRNQAAAEGLSEATAAYLERKELAALASQLNGRAGVSALAASSVYTVSKTFVSSELTEATVYLYVFEYGAPVIVTFLPGEDGSVSAAGCFLLAEDFSADSAETILNALEEFPDASVEKIA